MVLLLFVCVGTAGNGIKEEGWIRIAEALEKNTSLISVCHDTERIKERLTENGVFLTELFLHPFSLTFFYQSHT
jgi:hypothetical protein